MEQNVKQLSKMFETDRVMMPGVPPTQRTLNLPPPTDAQTSSDEENASSTSDRAIITISAPKREMLRELENKLDEVSEGKSDVCANSTFHLFERFISLYRSCEMHQLRSMMRIFESQQTTLFQADRKKSYFLSSVSGA